MKEQSRYQQLRALAEAEAMDDEIETIDASEITIVSRAPRRPDPAVYEQARRLLVIDAAFEALWCVIWIGAFIGGLSFIYGALAAPLWLLVPEVVVLFCLEAFALSKIAYHALAAKTTFGYRP